MKIYRNTDEQMTIAPESTFTGDVLIGGYFQRSAPSRLSGAVVTFPPGARTPWKVNTMGQTLVVTSGAGRAQNAGEPIREIRTGDLVWCPPGEEHWEGAAADESMTYVAVQESAAVRFGRAVTDAEYAGSASAESR